LAATLAEAYQSLKRHEGDEQRATLDYDDASFIADVDDVIARLRSRVSGQLAAGASN
jgi:hypothetical protein